MAMTVIELANACDRSEAQHKAMGGSTEARLTLNLAKPTRNETVMIAPGLQAWVLAHGKKTCTVSVACADVRAWIAEEVKRWEDLAKQNESEAAQ